MKYLCIILLSSIGLSVQISTPEDNHYVAAVVEYSVSGDVAANKERYAQLTRDAAQQNADIIVFPELTLTNSSVAFAVPIHSLLREYPVPAVHPELYDELLVAMSAAARDNNIYLVINVRELMDCTKDTGETCPEAKEYIFNTNVVFDRTGAVIDRYRKINLFGEHAHTPALQPDLGVFTTDFGVTFGHFICFDLMFQVPAVQVVQKNNIRNIIFPTMWFSELPYLTAVQIQEAYSYAMDVNFLGAGANRVSVGSAGSGIYSGKAGALVSTMPGIDVTRLLVATVPKVPGQVTWPVPGPIYDTPSDHDGLRLIVDPSLPSQVSRLLEDGDQEFTIFDKDVSCSFRVKMSQRNGASQRYKYRATAFSGVRSFSGVATGGSRICSVVACTGDTMDTCGHRFSTYTPNTTAHFEELTITGTVPTPQVVPTLDADDSTFFPLASTVSIMPLEPQEYSYSFTQDAEKTTHTLTLRNLDAELYNFALWGRIFATDGLEADPPLEENSTDSSVTNVVSRMLVAFMIAIILYY